MARDAGPVTDRPKLQKAIAHSGLMSRRAAEDLIARGRVKVDGRTASVGDRVDPHTQTVEVDGRPIPVRPGLVTYLVNKPPGVISTARDPQGRRVVTDLVPDSPRVYPVGRLDADSEGLMLLTNDGTLADLVTHPRHGIEKTYLVMVEGDPGPWVEDLTRGVDLEDGPARASRARVVDSSRGRTLVEMVMGEGRNREVRRMCRAVGKDVIRLVRTAV
ncbi:MAG: pseudouridine synthase, partial [Actinomycetota bacterium]